MGRDDEDFAASWIDSGGNMKDRDSGAPTVPTDDHYKKVMGIDEETKERRAFANDLANFNTTLSLTPIEKKIIRYIYESPTKATYREMGAVLGVSIGHISKVMKNMKAKIQNYYYNGD